MMTVTFHKRGRGCAWTALRPPRSVVPGPTPREHLGGFYLIDVPTREAAIAIAQRCPAAEWCTVEVRALAPCYDESAA